ncbi:Thermostable beta-glucosidase B [uncultured Clostridium sp.]|jgi:beta-glucosidase|nr:Thermostable beta-glucosidase B [uncultured Clostridium sp.]
MKRNLKELISQMTLEEKAGMCSGLDFWHLKGVERLGIPSVMVSDGPHGLRKQDQEADHLGINESIKAVCFPPAVLSACSFDRALLERLGETVGDEAQATDLSVVLGPAVNIKRSPLCGRNFEYYSEDPYLAGEAAAAFINGVQSRHVGTSIKHFAANNQEFNRMSASSEVDERTMREIYLPAFETAVKKSQPYTVMCSYNRINGTYASENPWLLTKVLRDEWGFEGYVMSDWGAVNDRVEGLKAGLELEMPASGGINDAEIVKAVQEGTLDEAVLDRAVERILNIVFEYVDNRKEQPLTLEKDHEFAQHVAEESIVLLKNEAVLPLEEQENVAFIGGFVKNPRYQGGGSSHVNSFKVTSAWDALEEKKNVTYAEGFSSEKDEYDEKLAAEAIETAKKADKAIIFAGLPESFESEGYDRKHMHLPECQNKLIEEIVKVQPNTIVVLHNGAAVEMPWLKSVKGLVEAYLGGQAVGQALVNILYGAVNPSGKLAETLPIKLEDNPSYLNFGDGVKVEYHEGIFVGYRYYEKKKMDVAFPFGHGLSYTTFKYSNLRTDKDTMTEGETIQVSVDVTNIGDRAGKEIVQLYVSDLTNAARRPEKELKGFEKVALNPGETKTVTFTVDKRSLAWYNTEIQDWYAASGTYEILIASSSRDIRLTKTIQWESAQILPLHLHLNTTLGELLSDERTKALGKELKGKLDSFFGGLDGEANEPTEGDEAVSDDMGDAIAFSMPIRNVVSFGLCDKEELIKRLEELNSR